MLSKIFLHMATGNAAYCNNWLLSMDFKNEGENVCYRQSKINMPRKGGLLTFNSEPIWYTILTINSPN